MSQTTLVLATRNPGKLRELRDLLSGWPLDLRSLDDIGFGGVLGTRARLHQLALAKATTVCLATDLPALADDSGIEVDALHGWPGPQSARWMGDEATDEDRMHGLLAEVARRTPDDRRARYVCVAALARPGAEPVTAHGECLGSIVAPPRGSNGFGSTRCSSRWILASPSPKPPKRTRPGCRIGRELSRGSDRPACSTPIRRSELSPQ